MSKKLFSFEKDITEVLLIWFAELDCFMHLLWRLNKHIDEHT